ncbi:MAG: hypothetical protein A2162_10560 [Deltaproteobacteria bacterium RBG_13_52_11b]|nr:MAG: hypothetical protein A2162_10560 [Deltaproteobacteria bacterium RBG_13_52_11b]
MKSKFHIQKSSVFCIRKKTKKAFRSIGKKIASGDPDLFVYNENIRDRFFVEVKENDQITDNQKVLFPLIEEFLCPVFIARVIAEVIP